MVFSAIKSIEKHLFLFLYICECVYFVVVWLHCAFDRTKNFSMALNNKLHTLRLLCNFFMSFFWFFASFILLPFLPLLAAKLCTEKVLDRVTNTKYCLFFSFSFSFFLIFGRWFFLCYMLPLWTLFLHKEKSSSCK